MKPDCKFFYWNIILLTVINCAHPLFASPEIRENQHHQLRFHRINNDDFSLITAEEGLVLYQTMMPEHAPSITKFDFIERVKDVITAPHYHLYFFYDRDNGTSPVALLGYNLTHSLFDRQSMSVNSFSLLPQHRNVTVMREICSFMASELKKNPFYTVVSWDIVYPGNEYICELMKQTGLPFLEGKHFDLDAAELLKLLK